VRVNPDLINSRMLLAAYYLKQNESGKALQNAREGIRNRKTDAQLYNVIADASLRQRKIDEALKALHQAVEADPVYDATYFKLAAIHRFQGEQEQALALLKTFAGNVPQNARAQLAAAWLLESAGNGREARVFYDRAVKTGSVEGFVESARYHLRNGKPDTAAGLLEECLRKHSASPGLLLLKGQAYLAQKKYEDAIRTYEDLARTDLSRGLTEIVSVYLGINRPEKAMDRVRREMKKNPGLGSLQAELSRIYLQMGKTDEAASNARLMIEREPGSALGYMTLAMAYERARQRDKAIDVLRKASHISDENLSLMLGNLYAAQKKYALALAEYQKAQTLKPGAVPAFLQRASVLLALGKRSEAIAEYLKLLKQSPDSVPAMNNLAYLYAADDATLSTALTYAVRAYTRAPGDGAVLDTLGYILLRKGRIEDGFKALQQAAAAAPDNPSIQYHLALAAQARGDTTGAVAALTKAIGYGDFPESAHAKTLLSELQKRTASR
jgi:putative PEP-CTERM system TPR-repeat lipoprotein